MAAGWVSDDTTKHVAEVIDAAFTQPVISLAVAEALAAAGLLCTPQERAVIDTAIAETEAETRLPAAARALDAPKRDITLREYDRLVKALQDAKTARRAAVTEHNQHRNPK